MKRAPLILRELVLKCIEDATPFPWPIKSKDLTLSGPAFSVVRQARGGSEARMPKIKVNIN